MEDMTTKTLIQEALSAPRCVISVIGDHAGEGVTTIFHRKLQDIRNIHRTFWLVKSQKAKPPSVQKICNLNPAHVIFIEAAVKSGARPTIANTKASTFSEDGLTWCPLPANLGPVTGKLDSQAYALVFDRLEMSDGVEKIDLWSYADFSYTEKPVRMILGCSTVCVTRQDMSQHPDRLKSRFRGIVAVARLAAPYCVWVR
jgi:hypothetical protein